MNEHLLQFIWQHQYYHVQGLTTPTGSPLQILHHGQLNHHQGPDFFNGRLRLDGIVLAGTIELHLRTSDWNRHGHSHDAHYRNVILHVVWEHDRELNQTIPVLELRNRIPRILLERYRKLLEQPEQLPCRNLLDRVPELTWVHWKERLVVERLLLRQEKVQELLHRNRRHWEETCWQLLARNFGLPLNADAFEAIAATLPVALLSRHRQQIQQLEALLLGQAGLLETAGTDPYVILLHREYHYLRRKYGLQPAPVLLQFARMRPAHFPTVRLAQLAMLFQQSGRIFSDLSAADSLDEMKRLLRVTANDFWHRHYTLTEKSAFQPKQLGEVMVNALLINAVLPLLFAYAAENRNAALREKIPDYLQQLPKESNRVLRIWQESGVANKNAFDSQALLQLYKHYCSKGNCLSCSVGHAVLKPFTPASES
ncbi:MAG TPA: DUF2851 family protein [Lacibacter sp.]|nr:DUF2851 family protein [Lacibacter sp.]